MSGTRRCQLGGICSKQDSKQQCKAEDKRVLGGGKSVSAVCSNKCTSESCPVENSVCDIKTTKCVCRKGFYAQGQTGHATLCVSRAAQERYMSSGMEVVGQCVDASKDKHLCSTYLSHPSFGCNAKYGWQNMASNCQASCGKYCAPKGKCKPIFKDKYCVPIKDGNCMDTTAIDYACPHHKVGAAVPDICDTPHDPRDDQCAATFTRWWAKCGSKLKGISSALRKEFNSFNTKCIASVCQRCVRNGGKCTAAEGGGRHRLLQQGAGSAKCLCKKGYDPRTLCAKTLAPPPPSPGSFTSTSSSACPVTDGGKCVHSRGYPSSDYNARDHCTIQVHGAGNLRALPGFDVESGSDYLTIDGHKYGGHNLKGGFSVKVTSSSKITWATDRSAQYHGWKVCIGPAPPAPPLGSCDPKTGPKTGVHVPRWGSAGDSIVCRWNGKSMWWSNGGKWASGKDGNWDEIDSQSYYDRLPKASQSQIASRCGKYDKCCECS
eukprot:COSAG01_NODE_1295_length_10874_cov_10.154710_2_plen_490_part_00